MAQDKNGDWKIEFIDKDMSNIAPESSKSNPQHKSLQNYLKIEIYLIKLKIVYIIILTKKVEKIIMKKLLNKIMQKMKINKMKRLKRKILIRNME